ncbi:MAG: tRNA pseudouridine(38-40) synthase TruA [Acidobacteria bacterium RIFCSPLOWO2_02_FULL_61_28]|nr:MAG: tRNA pseudouridine(38-40) synthase TruA [Acidobacteria bacterium RIFCSPLOWO2_02_FULL_61_28]
MSASNEPRPLRNLLLRVAYDGTDFHGWQIQPDRPTIQGTLTAAIAALCGETVHVCGSGRTDAGVHAEEQAANVTLQSPIPCANLARALNDHLPESIRVLSAQEVPLEFHARGNARSKMYRYRIYRGATCPPTLSRYVFPYPYPLDEAAMAEAARFFVGTWDFRPFASKDASSAGEERSTVRTVFSSRLERQGEELRYTVEGSGFLYHMVRNIVGTLFDVGRHRIEAAAIRELLAAGQGAASGSTAPARGLTLVRVAY